MFVGHYAAALALEAIPKAPRLPVLFLGVQLIDVGFFGLVLGGIEKFRVTPGITAMNPLDLYYMPYTHSLLGATVWAVAFGVVVALLAPARARLMGGLIAAAAVFSHWVLDFLVHTHDLGLLGDNHKVGLGLWNYPAIEMVVEAGMIAAALWLYARITRPKGRIGSLTLLIMAVIIAALQAVNWFGPPPTSETIVSTSVTALAAYGLFVLLAWWLDATRTRAA